MQHRAYLKNLFHAIVILAISLSASFGFAEAIDGTLIKSDKGFFFKQGEKTEALPMKFASKEVSESAQKLESGDYISGNAEFDSSRKSLVLVSIDYVGLRKILGTWIGTNGVLSFESFSDIMVYSPTHYDVSLRIFPPSVGKRLKYSISPADGSTWTLFMTDSVSTVLADLEISRDQAKLTIFDPDDGDVKSVLYLTKFNGDRNVKR